VRRYTHVIRPTVASFVIGEVIFVSGIALRFWAVRTLGEYFTTTVQTAVDQPVITTGPYRILRHPSYTGILLYAIGSGFVVGNWIGLVAMTLLTLVPLVYRIRVEEDALTSALGEDYCAYASRHKRLIPGIW
jgi:protein-S-isoprenylcysteine O-methyltransferase Ste14